MSAFLDFFEFMPPWQKFLWIVFVLGFFWVLEGYYAFAKNILPYLKSAKHNKWKHAKTNAILLAFVMIINTSFGIATVGIFNWLETTKFGFLHLIDAPVWVELLLAILVLDFIAQYGVHYLLHKVKWMWKLHLVHHSDTHVDATTGTRHHPFDFLLRESFALLAVFITGMPIAFYFFYRIVTIFFTYWTHADIALPKKLDKAISYVFVTPVMHKFHHHHEMPWTDTNFGNVFSLWDRIFGTFVYGDASQIVYGLDIVDKERDDDIKYQLGLPFDKEVTYKN